MPNHIHLILALAEPDADNIRPYTRNPSEVNKNNKGVSYMNLSRKWLEEFVQWTPPIRSSPRP